MKSLTFLNDTTIPRRIFLVLAIGSFGAALNEELTYRFSGGKHDWITEAQLILFGVFCAWASRKRATD